MSRFYPKQHAGFMLAYAVALVGAASVVLGLLDNNSRLLAANGLVSAQQTAYASKSFAPGLMRIDFSIVSSEPLCWEGYLQLSRGEFSNLVSLGSNVSSSTDFLFSDSTQSQLVINTKSRTSFCGLETTLIAPKDARLEIQLRDKQSGKSLKKTVFIDRLIESSIHIPFDKSGNGIEIVRAPADELPVCLESLDPNVTGTENGGLVTTVFSPNEQIRLTTLPRSLTARLPNDLLLSVSAKMKNAKEPFWKETRELSLSDLQRLEASISDSRQSLEAYQFFFQAPDVDCVFDVELKLLGKEPTPAKTTFALSPSSKRQTLPTVFARRIAQCIVVSPSPGENTSKRNQEISLDDLKSELLETVDPTNPTWYKAFSKRGVLPFYKNSLKNFKDVNDSYTSGNDSENKFASPKRTFANVNPSKSSNDASSTHMENESTILGQTYKENDSVSNKNFLSGVVPSFNSNVKGNTVPEQRSSLQQWKPSSLQSFVRNFDQRAWGSSSDLWDKPLSSGTSRPFNEKELAQFATAQSRFLRLEPNKVPLNPNSWNEITSTSWEAYPIPIEKSGLPYILEVEYPANFPQKLDISVLEQSITGGLFQSSFDFGLVVSNDELSDRSTNEIARQSILFWPRTHTPIIVLSNGSSETPAAYGQIRIYRADNVNTCSSERQNGRTFGLALTSPNIVGQFAANKARSSFGVVGSENWESFDDSISRMIYYLTASNIDTAVLSVVGNGATLYPSRHIGSSAKYDDGVFLTDGGDFVKKDVLSAILARTSKANKGIVPLVNLNSPCAELESKLSKVRLRSTSAVDQAALEGIEWIGSDGRRLIDSRLEADGSGPYYNILHPEVEKQTLAIIKELVSACSSYDSFEGLALDVGSNGWLALPDEVYYGMDDETIARFVRESNLQEILANKSDRRVQELLLAKGDGRYRKRAEFIRDVCLNEWLEWRIDALYNFYREVRQTIASSRPDLRLYLVAAHALDGPVCKSMLYPSLSSNKKIREALRLVGLDPCRYAPESKRKNSSVIQVAYTSGKGTNNKYDNFITLLRPEIIASEASFSHTALLDELKSPDVISLFNGAQLNPGNFFYHELHNKTLDRFNELSPILPAAVEIQAQALPAGYENRRRFAKALAIEDSLCFFDGGDAIPMGQEETLNHWIHVFTSLPQRPFKTWSLKSEINSKSFITQASNSNDDNSVQPLVVRFSQTDKDTWFYLLNAAPFHLGVKLQLTQRPNCNYEIFASDRHEPPKVFGESLEWTFTASPYDLVAIRVEDAKVVVNNLEVSRPQEICGIEGRINNAVQDFVERVLAARGGIAQPLRNGDFEESFDSESIAVLNERDSQDNNVKRQDKSNLLGIETAKIGLFKKSRSVEANSEPHNGRDALDTAFDSTNIPGWRPFGPSDVDVRLDETIVNSGRASLRISSSQNTGGIVCQPFAPPSTGRLCAQICFGIPVNAETLPLNVCLVGNYNGEQFNRRILVGPTLLKRSQNLNKVDSESGVVWVRDVVLFDRLPLEGLTDLSIRFELCGQGVIWLDQIKLYKLAFADAEQNELMKIINAAEFRASKDRSLDVLFMLDGYWAKMLKQEIASDSPLLTNHQRRPANVASIPANEKEAERPKGKNVFNRTMSKLKFW